MYYLRRTISCIIITIIIQLKNEELRDRYQERRSSSFEITYNYGSRITCIPEASGDQR